jgi:hypothetical protein
MSQVDRIVSYLNSHDMVSGQPTVISHSEQRIKVRSVVSDASGACEVVEEIIPATMSAARNWLGY